MQETGIEVSSWDVAAASSLVPGSKSLSQGVRSFPDGSFQGLITSANVFRLAGLA